MDNTQAMYVQHKRKRHDRQHKTTDREQTGRIITVGQSITHTLNRRRTNMFV